MHIRKEVPPAASPSTRVLRVATNTLFMAFPDVHDVCYVKGR